MKNIFLAVLLFIIATLGPSYTHAQTESSGTKSGEPIIQHDLDNVLRQLDIAWGKASEKLAQGSLHDIHEELQVVGRLQQQGGITALVEYSNILLKEAQHRLTVEDVEAAQYLTRKALEFSPDSPSVMFNALSIVGQVGVDLPWTLGLKAVMRIPHEPILVAGILLHIIYPVMWALTLGLYAVFVLFNFFWLVELLRTVAYFFPPRIRGIAAPILTFVVLSVPIFFGPIACFIAWALFLWITDRRRVWPCLCAGVIVCLWGLAIPIRERLALWIDAPGTQALLNYSSGIVGGADRFKLAQLVRAQPNNGVAWFAYGQLLRRYGEYPRSLEAITTAHTLIKKPWVLAERAVVLSLMGKQDQAITDLKRAEDEGYNSAEFYFNYSKIALNDFDTAAVRDYMGRAMTTDPLLTALLKSREEALGARHPSTFADVRIPPGSALNTMWEAGFAPVTTKAAELLPGASSFMLSVIGMALCLLPVFPSAKAARRRLSPYFAEYAPSSFALWLVRTIPAGGWVTSNRPIWSIISFTVLAYFAMPWIGWPAESRWLGELYPNWTPAYAAVCGIVVLLVMAAGWASAED